MVVASTHVATVIVTRTRDHAGIVAITGTTVSARIIAAPAALAATVVVTPVVTGTAAAVVTAVGVGIAAVAAAKGVLVTAIAIGTEIRTEGRASVRLRVPATMAAAMTVMRKPTARSPSARRKWQTALLSLRRPWLRLRRRVA